MLTDKNNQFNLTDEINEAAKTLIEEQELISDQKAIASIIHDYISQHLEEIVWHYHNSNSLQNKVFTAEVETEKLAA